MIVHVHPNKEAVTNLAGDGNRDEPKKVQQIQNIFAWLFVELIRQRDDFKSSCSLSPNENCR